jgi:hypothetical protein
MEIDYLWSDDGLVHAINCLKSNNDLDVGILCLMAIAETTIRIANDKHSFLVEIPKEFQSQNERVKAFNATLNILSHEQV